LEKNEYWTTYCKSWEQPVLSNTLQEAFGFGCFELQITLPQSQVFDVVLCCLWRHHIVRHTV